MYVEQEFVVALINGSYIEAKLTAAHHNDITGVKIGNIGKLALLISGNANACVVHQHIVLLFCAFSGHIHQRVVMAVKCVNVCACNIFKAGLHNGCEGGVVGAVCDDINADLVVNFTDEGTVYLDPAAVFCIQSFQSGGGQSAKEYIACAGGIAGSGIVLSQGGTVCRIVSAQRAVYIGISLAGTQADKHIVGECSLQTCGAGYGFHPLVGGERGIMIIA